MLFRNISAISKFRFSYFCAKNPRLRQYPTVGGNFARITKQSTDMNNKEKLISYLKENTDILNNLIESELKDDEIQFAIDYIEKLNTISKHNITKIGHTENGDFYLTCETGITYLK